VLLSIFTLVAAKYQHRIFFLLVKKQFGTGRYFIKKQDQLTRGRIEAERGRALILNNSSHTLMQILVKPSRNLAHTLDYRMRGQRITYENMDMCIKKTLLYRERNESLRVEYLKELEGHNREDFSTLFLPIRGSLLLAD